MKLLWLKPESTHDISPPGDSALKSAMRLFGGDFGYYVGGSDLDILYPDGDPGAVLEIVGAYAYLDGDPLGSYSGDDTMLTSYFLVAFVMSDDIVHDEDEYIQEQLRVGWPPTT